MSAEAVLHLSWRPDGGLRVHSPTHPGLVLSHSRPDLVMLDVLPVLAEMGFTASAIEAASADKTENTGLAVGESATRQGDAQQVQP